MADIQEATSELARSAAEKLAAALNAQIPGQRAAVHSLLAAYIAGGHALLEGVPGIGKTLLARTLAASLGLSFGRVQFTPDLMPQDVIGSNVFDAKAGSFRLVKGPIFTELLMADEINRTPPKTQAALLEAMQERHVTIDTVTHALPQSFFVIATQNPIEFEGTYPLPEAQLDRFLLRVEMGLPEEQVEMEIYRRAAAGQLAGWNAVSAAPPVLDPAEARQLRGASARVHVAPELLGYVMRLAQGARRSPHIELGVSPRAVLCLIEAARASALLAERDFVLPEDVKSLLVATWAHRLVLTAEAELEGHSPRGLLEELARTVEVPR